MVVVVVVVVAVAVVAGDQVETKSDYLPSAHQDSVGVGVRHRDQKDQASYHLKGRRVLAQADADRQAEWVALDLRQVGRH